MSARPFWTVACADPQTRAITLEMAAVEQAALADPQITPEVRAGAVMASTETYHALDACLTTAAPQPCLRQAAMGLIGQFLDSSRVPLDYQGDSSIFIIFCPAVVGPVRIVRVESDPVTLWISSPYGAVMDRDMTDSAVVFRGDGENGPLEFRMNDSGDAIYSGVRDTPIDCYVPDPAWLQ